MLGSEIGLRARTQKAPAQNLYHLNLRHLGSGRFWKLQLPLCTAIEWAQPGINYKSQNALGKRREYGGAEGRSYVARAGPLNLNLGDWL